jgi:integrase
MVAKLKAPDSGQVDYFDSLLSGLILRVGYGGAKTWLVRHYLKRLNKAGKRVSVPTTYKIGRYPILKVKEAREKARLFLAAYLADPVKAKAQVTTGSFREVADNFIKRYVEEEKLRTRKQIARRFERLVYPHWGDKPFRDIKRSDVAELVDRIVDTSGPRAADKTLSDIRKLCNWFSTRDDDYQSPIVKGMGRYDAVKHRGRRILSDDEIRGLWTTAAELGTFGAWLKVALLTAQRKDKIATMRWDDIRNAVWTIRTVAREKPNAGSLCLPPAVLEIIKARPRIAGNPYVFAGRDGRPFNNFSQGKAALDAELAIPPWKIHDLRRTAKTLMVRAGVRPDISERVLGHTIRGVEGVYDQHDYGAEKADALIRLAGLIDRIINPPAGNVEDLEQARARKQDGAARGDIAAAV